MIENFVVNLGNMLPFGYAFGAGMATTVSPCGIAMLPAYVSLYLGVEGEGLLTGSSLRRVSQCTTLGGIILNKPALKKHIWTNYQVM